MARIQSRRKRNCPKRHSFPGNHRVRSCFRKQGAPNGEDFCPQTRRFSAAILGGLQGKATQYASKKTARAVCNDYENGFLAQPFRESTAALVCAT